MTGSDRDDRAGQLDWFEDLYRDAGGDPDKVPWARLEAHPGLVHWAEQTRTHSGRAIDIGCGLGDNAEYLAGLGYAVTAFDLSETAVYWAGRRFPETSVDYCQADLFSLPADWVGAFGLVSEVYTLQALPAELRGDALQRIAGLVAPGGRIVVVCMAREEDEAVDGPPWPLAKSELAGFAAAGLVEEQFSDLVLGENARRHFVATFRRPG